MTATLYKQIDYIESNGSQMIDPLYSIGSSITSMEYEICFDINSTAYSYVILSGYAIANGGALNDSIPAYSGMLTYDKGILYTSVGVESNLNPTELGLGTHTVKVVIGNGTCTETIDGVETTFAFRGSFGTSTGGGVSLSLFAQTPSATATKKSSALAIRSWSLKTNNTLVRDMVAALDSDLIPCMYDKVAQRLYYNDLYNGYDYTNFDAGRIINPISYVVSDGTQSVDLDIPGSSDINFETKIALLPDQEEGWNTIIGGMEKTGENSYLLAINMGLNMGAMQLGTSNFISFPINLSYNTDYIFKIENNSLYIDGTLIATLPVTTFDTGDYSLNLFKANSKKGLGMPLKAKLYYAKVWKSGTLVRNMIGSIDSYGYAFLYDTVHTKYYDISGNKFEHPTIDLQGITNIKGQYIDTEYKFNPLHRIEVKYAFSSATLKVDEGVCGCDSVSPITKTNFTGRPYVIFLNGYSSIINYRDLETANIDTADHIVEFNKSGYAYIDGSAVALAGSKVASENNLLLFCRNDKTIGPNAFTLATIYYLKIYEDSSSTLLHNFVPKIINNEIGFYDTIENTFHTNKGFGILGARFQAGI